MTRTEQRPTNACRARNKQALQVDHANDDIPASHLPNGGIDTEQALSEWWRGQSETVSHYNAEVPGNLRRQGAFAFKRGGQPIDTVIRRLEAKAICRKVQRRMICWMPSSNAGGTSRHGRTGPPRV